MPSNSLLHQIAGRGGAVVHITVYKLAIALYSGFISYLIGRLNTFFSGAYYYFLLAVFLAARNLFHYFLPHSVQHTFL